MIDKLTKHITKKEFENHYWYAKELKEFAKEIGIPNSSKLRKDELEELIKHFLKTGKIKEIKRKNILKKGKKDTEIGLTKSLLIRHYTSNKQTKNFIISEARKIVPDLKIKSGVWYRTNRWRDEQITKKKKITYGDLINQFIELNQTDKVFEKIPSTLFNSFIAEYLKNEKGATRREAMKEWEKLKSLKIKKDYKSWKRHNENRNSNNS